MKEGLRPPRYLPLDTDLLTLHPWEMCDLAASQTLVGLTKRYFLGAMFCIGKFSIFDLMGVTKKASRLSLTPQPQAEAVRVLCTVKAVRVLYRIPFKCELSFVGCYRAELTASALSHSRR